MSKAKSSYKRNPVYVIYAFIALLIYIICSLIAYRTQVGFFESTIFALFHRLPDLFLLIFAPILAVSLGGFTLFGFLFYLFKRRFDVALRLFVSVLFAGIITALIDPVRNSPAYLLESVEQRLTTASFAFPSVLMAIAVAGGLVISLYVSNNYRHYINYLLWGLASSLLFLGISLPIDILAGYAIGLLSFSLCSLLLGAAYSPIDPNKLSKSLRKSGLKDAKLKPLSADARGSTPFFGSSSEGPIFAKVYNRDNNAADWLFKVMRRIRYRRLEDEVPSLTAKRAIEHEAYVTLLAKSTAGVRTPDFIGIFKIEQNSYAMVTKLIDAKGLDSIESSKVTDKLLDSVWMEINKLHQSRIVHKDLRTANIMIENKTNLPWIIDFGFAETAIGSNAYYKDIVEFTASSAVIVGAKRAVKSAYSSIDRNSFKKAIPYMQYSAISGATTTLLKQNKGLLEQIRSEMSKVSKASAKETKKARMKRI
jgi:undecaprenyl-diphosphatase